MRSCRPSTISTPEGDDLPSDSYALSLSCRNHWKEWRMYSRKHSTRWVEIRKDSVLFLLITRSLFCAVVWIVICFLTITLLCLYISASDSKPLRARNYDTEDSFGESAGSLFYSASGYTPFHNFMLNSDYRDVPRTQTSSRGMVASDHGKCSDMGGKILNWNGNAMDAAVTTALCIGIRNPFASGTGGGTFILVHLDNGTSTVIDAREVAPKRATEEMFKGRGSDRSPLFSVQIVIQVTLVLIQPREDCRLRFRWNCWVSRCCTKSTGS